MTQHDYFNPNQPRDARGRFSGGAGSGPSTPPGRSGGRRTRGPAPARRADLHARAARAAREAGQASTARAHRELSRAYAAVHAHRHEQALAAGKRGARALYNATDTGHPLFRAALAGVAGVAAYLHHAGVRTAVVTGRNSLAGHVKTLLQKKIHEPAAKLKNVRDKVKAAAEIARKVRTGTL